jgi:hypothetical protein
LEATGGGWRLGIRGRVGALGLGVGRTRPVGGSQLGHLAWLVEKLPLPLFIFILKHFFYFSILFLKHFKI